MQSRSGRGWLHALLIAGLLSFAAGAGCAPEDRAIRAFMHEQEAHVSAAGYQVEPPDTLEISSAQAPEIDGEQQMVRQDGKIALRLLGEVQVAGLTPVEIARKLESLLSKYYVDPQVNVRVSQPNSKQYFVFGDGSVRRQGAFPFTGRDTVLSAVAAAMPNTLAWRAQIKLIRPSQHEKRRHVITVDLDRMVMNGDTAQNVLLQEGDIIWVPPTPLAWVGLRLSELVYPLVGGAQAVALPAYATNSWDAYQSN